MTLPRMAVALVAAITVCAATPADAKNFRIRNLLDAPDAGPLLGADYISRVEADRVTLVCTACDGLPVIDILIGPPPDDTQERLRSGETTIADMQAICQSRDPACLIEGLPVEPAVGYISSYRIGGQFGHTVVVMRDRDMLTIRSLSQDAATARRNADTLIASFVPLMVGN